MIKELEYPFDSVGVLRKKRALKKRCLEQRENWLEIRIAVLCGSTVADICDILELFLLNEGIRPQFYQSEFGKYWEDAVFDNPELDLRLYGFIPAQEILIVCRTSLTAKIISRIN